jgi:glycerophosphoryl diester phosphodiesterase
MTAPEPLSAGPRIRVREIARAVAGDLRWSLFDLTLFDLLFRAAAAVIIVPAATWAFRLAVGSGGDQAIGNFDILLFVLTPLGFAATLMAILVALTLAFAEGAGMAWIGYAAAGGERLTWLDALRQVGRQLARILQACFLGLVTAVAVSIPSAIGLAITWQRLLSSHDINYYLATRPPEWTTALWLGATLLIPAAAAVLVVYWVTSYALAGVLFRGQKVRTAFSSSLRLLRRHGSLMVVPLTGWLALWIVVALAAGWIGREIGELLVRAAGQQMELLLATLGFLLVLDLFGLLVFGFLLAAVHALLMARLYREACRRSSLPRAPEWSDGSSRGRAERRLPKWQWIAGGAVVAIAAAVVTVYGLAEAEDLGERVRIVAHRGSSRAAPENTLAAIRQAVDDGADFVEIDVQLTGDGRIVVCHDADLMRLAGDPRVITETTYDELREVDVGSWFASGFADERLPTLVEAIEAVRGRAGLLVEIKSYRADGEDLVARVVETLRSEEMVGDAAIMSLEYAEVREARRLAPEFPAGFTVSAAMGRLARLDVDFLAVGRSNVTGPLIAQAHAQDKQIWVWTVNRPAQMSRMIELGVDGIITDEPATLNAVKQERAELNPAERLLLRFRHLYLD